MTYTVKEVAELAGVTVRTLHYYDEIGLLEPTRVGENGYRYYEDEAVYRLQQILFFRELDMRLDDIKAILNQPHFDRIQALEVHRRGLVARVKRLQRLITTINQTLDHLTGGFEMSKNQLFQGFDQEEEAHYRQEAEEHWGAEEVKATYQRWNNYSKQQQQAILTEGQAIYDDLVAAMDQGADSPAVQAIIARWHEHMRYFYEPSVARLRGLGQLYIDHPDFAAKFQALHPDLPAFMQTAINIYCDGLEASGADAS